MATWRCGDRWYVSVPFTWQLGKAELAARAARQENKALTIVAGGPAVKLAGAPWADETPDSCPFDVLAMHNPCATFTTRGCPNRCPWCAVPRIEGDFQELPIWKPAPIICDNNLLAASRAHFSRVIDSLKPFPASDFNQGLDARFFTPWHAEQIRTLRNPKVRFAFDRLQDETALVDAVARCRANRLLDLGVYVLVGFHDTPEDALYRLRFVQELGIRPTPMRFQPLDALEKNAYVAPGWTDQELHRMVRYFSRLRWFEHVPYEDFQVPSASLFP